MVAVILAAGRGARFGANQNKVFVPLLGCPLLGWTLQAFVRTEIIRDIVLVGSSADLSRLEQIAAQYGGRKVRAIVPGGSDRQESVRNGVAAAGSLHEGPVWIAAHDAARPCITPEAITRVVQAAQVSGAATLAVPVTDTLVRESDEPDGTEATQGEGVSRDRLWAIQTPQVFRAEWLREAHERAAAEQRAATDDARLVTDAGYTVQLIPGSSENLKVTHPGDLALAEAILARREEAVRVPEFRVGFGYDVHPFAEGRRLYLGGVEFTEADRGLLGHSDADVLLHAVCDALLGAAGMGDIGKLFPPSDMRHKDRRSTEFLSEVKARLDEAGWQIVNLDITVLAEKPKIGPRSEVIRETIGVLISVDPSRIGLKATTNEGLGFIGREEGIAVHAVAMLVRS
ncbi:MAG: bifunctional 2-C-methyl-D-erythritol 4-phosphate cytidylyltransferase/2-C-methyl-D-erythritol 2,4-cyclodiphosphate synthase [Armatimonadaceae bacterium]